MASTQKWHSVFVFPGTRRWYMSGAAPTQQAQKLESDKGENAKTPPLVYGPPGTCRRSSWCFAEQARRRKWGVQEEDPVLLSDLRQGQPQMPPRSHHCCHGPLIADCCHHCMPIAREVSLEVRRDRSAVLLSSVMSSAFTSSPSFNSLSRSAWYVCQSSSNNWKLISFDSSA